MGKFLIYTGENGWRFHLRSANGETIATSEVYTSRNACAAGIRSIGRNGPGAKLENLVNGSGEKVTNPKFQVYRDRAGEYRFRLRARNGEVIASSQGYATLEGCLGGVESVRANASDAQIEMAPEGGG